MKTLREYIDLIEDKSADPVAQQLIALTNNSIEILQQIADNSTEQELDEINWRKGLAGAAAAGALALGAGGAQAAGSAQDWQNLGYCAMVDVVSAAVITDAGYAKQTNVSIPATQDYAKKIGAVADAQGKGAEFDKGMSIASSQYATPAFRQGRNINDQMSAMLQAQQKCLSMTKQAAQNIQQPSQIVKIPKQGQQTQQYNNIPPGERAEDYARRLGVY